MDKEAFKDFMQSMGKGITQRKIDLYMNVVGSSKIDTFTNVEEFYFAILKPWEDIIEGYIRKELNDTNDLVFIIQNYRFLELSFTKVIEEYEGMTCCADKSRFIINSLVRFFKEGKQIVFNYDQEYTFHLPKKIFTSHQEVITFYNGLKGIRYGNYKKYLQALKEVILSKVQINESDSKKKPDD